MARPRVVTLSIHAAVFAALAAWSWRKWPDPLIDFGRELYVPWQITRGKILYRDIASLFGPLSSYVNALWFRLFGVSLTTLVFCNLAIFAAMLTGIYHLVRTSTDRRTATLVTVSVMLLFGFSQYVGVANYNFVTPYSHEATHGLALSVAMLVALHHGLAARRTMLCAIGGLCFGGVLLTKPETAIAAAVAAVAGFVAMYVRRVDDRRPILQAIALFAVAATVPALAFYIYFRQHVPPDAALRAVAGAWIPVLESPVAGSTFYRHVTGLDEPLPNLMRMLLMLAGFAAFIVIGAFIAVRTGRSTSVPVSWRIARLAFLVAVVLLIPLSAVFRVLPLSALLAFTAFAVLWIRRAGDRANAVRPLPMVMWSAFAFALLAKIALNAHVFHYGFYLALPATSVTVVLLAWLVPQWLQNWNTATAARQFKAMVMWALVAAIAPYLTLSYRVYSAKTILIGTDGDRFYGSDISPLSHATTVRDALDQLLQLSRPGATVAILPEGVMLNYLARRETPLRVLNLMPPEWETFGEAEVLRSLQSAPPELILLVNRDVSEYGYPPFGTDAKYGRSIVNWMRSHYETVRFVDGDLPRNTSSAEVEILKRRPGWP